MKKTILLALIVLISNSAFCQITKKSRIIGGSLDFYGENLKNDSTNGVSNQYLKLSPNYGIYLSKTTAIGINLDFYTAKNTRRTIQITPFIKISKEINEKFYGMSRLDFNIRPNKKIESNKFASYGISWSPGIEYFLNNHWAISTTLANVSFNYSIQTPDNRANSRETKLTYNIKYNFLSEFGVIYRWGK